MYPVTEPSAKRKPSRSQYSEPAIAPECNGGALRATTWRWEE